MTDNVIPIDDITGLEQEAAAELAKERGEAARKRIKASLKAIADAKKIVANLELQHAALIADMKAGL